MNKADYLECLSRITSGLLASGQYVVSLDLYREELMRDAERVMNGILRSAELYAAVDKECWSRRGRSQSSRSAVKSASLEQLV